MKRALSEPGTAWSSPWLSSAQKWPWVVTPWVGSEGIKGRCHWGEHQTPAAPVRAQHLGALTATAPASCWPLHAVQDSKADAHTHPRPQIWAHIPQPPAECILCQRGESIPDPWILPQGCPEPPHPLTCRTSWFIRSKQGLVATILGLELGFGYALSGLQFAARKAEQSRQLRPHRSLHQGTEHPSPPAAVSLQPHHEPGSWVGCRMVLS